MNFKHVNPHNVKWLVPSWAADPFGLACALDDVLDSVEFPKRRPWKFWVQVDETTVRVQVPETESEHGNCGFLFIQNAYYCINIPIWELVKGIPRHDDQYTLYYHSFETETPLGYFGITKRRWFDRLTQHRSSATNGSPYLFHRAMREHASVRQLHRIILAGISKEIAYQYEEQFVALGTLYPLGLNMIPGGAAGIRYLHNFGVMAAKDADLDIIVSDLWARDSIEGRPNPLCAARWESDPDFAARVICGHSGRLTVEQVRAIRAYAGQGMSAQAIAGTINDRARRVASVLSGDTYGRVA